MERLADAAPVLHERADEKSRPARAARERRERARALPDERRALEKVSRRVAADRELGEDRQVRAGVLGPRESMDDARGVAGEVPDGRVDLAEREAHGGS